MDSNSQQKDRGQNKRFWTAEEDKILIDALVELSMDPMWRAENGFRGGFLIQLEIQLKATPNIESRVKHLRQNTNTIGDMLRLSGFDWNYENNTIMCEKSAYDEYVKTHKEAAGLYGKSWPFYNFLVQVFTKDRALGNNRGDIGDDAAQLEQDVDVAMEEDAGLSQIPVEDFFTSSQEPNESTSPMPSNNSASKTSVCRNRKGHDKDPIMEQMSENFRTFVDMVGPEFKTLAEATARNAESTARNAESAARNVEIAARNEATRSEVEKKKRLLGQVLFSIDRLTDDEAIFMLQVLAKDEDQLPNDKKLRFYRVLLRRMSYCPPSV